MDSSQKLSLEVNKPIILTKCTGNKKAMFMCTNDKCKQKSRFTCGSQDCQCELQHDLCLRANVNSIVKVIEKKNRCTDDLKNFINLSINRIIDEISVFHEQLISLVDSQMKFVQQFDVQRQFINLVKNAQTKQQKFDAKNSALLWKLIKSKDFGINKLFDDTKRLLKKLEQTSSITIANFNNQLNILIQKQIQNQEVRTVKLENALKAGKQQLSQIQKKLKEIIIAKSSVVKKSQYSERLIKFFPKPLKNMTLLYKASLNNFKLDKFYEICGKVTHTLILCQSNRGKIVGGYTPLCHYEQNLKSDYVFVHDPSLQSFICQLTTDRKFFLQNKDRAIIVSKNKDAVSFGDWEMKIINDANTNKNCLLDVNVYYKNNQFVTTDSLYKLNGAKFTTCTLVDWEVWKIQFQE